MTSLYILGISVGHNSSVTLMKDNEIVFHIEEERLTRVKRDSDPFRVLLEIPKYTMVIDAFVISGTHKIAKSSWRGEDYFTSLLKKIGVDVKKTIDWTNMHHAGHLFTSFYNSGFDDAIAVIVDGAGSNRTIKSSEDKQHVIFEAESIYRIDYDKASLQFQNLITNDTVYANSDHEKIFQEPTIVKMYEGVTQFLGWHPIEAGKTMGLSAYGELDDRIPKLYANNNRGSKDIFRPNYPASSMIRTDVDWYNLKEDEQFKSNLALRIQLDSEELAFELVKKAVELNPDCKNICIGGGYGLNVVNNYKLVKAFPEHTFWFEPACNDAGNSIGVCKRIYYQRTKDKSIQGIKDYYLGFEDRSIIKNKDYPQFKFTKGRDKKSKTSNIKKVAKLINDGQIVALYQGQSEAGPRALGNRSFLFNPTIKNSKDLMNKVKKREYFRPFATSVLEEKASEYFEMETIVKSPYMMIAFPTKEDKKDEIIGVVHNDGTCRIQTVTKEDNEVYRSIIEEFYKLSGTPMVMNTSFNGSNEPLVQSIDDALKTLEDYDFNYLYLADDNILVEKKKK